jgi:hypothetical protein
MIILMILRVGGAAHKIRSRIKIMSRSYLISAAPKYGWSFSGIATDPSGR